MSMQTKTLLKYALFSIAVTVFWPFTVAVPAQAQNTKGVFPAIIDEGHKSAEYRLTYDSERDVVAQRLHYQQSINDSIMWRIIGQVYDRDAQNNDYDFLGGELFWQFIENEGGFNAALRFDVRQRSNDRPGFVRANASAQYELTDRLSLRGNLLFTKDVGDDAVDTVGIELRESVTYRMNDRVQLGLESYNDFGPTGELSGFDNQVHEAGPFAIYQFNPKWSVFGGALYGISERAEDRAYRFRLTRNF